jgi:hypothetical protein
MKVYGAGDAGQGPTTFFLKEVASSLEFIVPVGTMKVYGAGDAGQGPTTFF